MKNFLILALIVVFEVLGNSCLSHGMRVVGDVRMIGPAALWSVGVRALTNPWVILGVILLIGYFLSFLTALSRLELSYVLPMTASGYVLTTIVAWRFLGETVSVSRWFGTCVIALGVVLVGLSERRRLRAASVDEPGWVP